uniref:Uncharacterized protein n=1 Tax=Aureoumbra lagunensis TaxID=44058 RepID=A0A7S3JUV7_9STRA|mmetsp:Transcript_18371/g.23899  ORF Transcript_18371/g.23899 Transcript_18371/m.23899 type:complete len:371 (+) Transcript_18371:1609-2721(+)|eukprot:CAMPEP_0197285904 /NCGR_PEP_ID=MMETSP0890-20130614/1262_1 /TAXON_ID=44058 ORGANISM="Aureoumbra lagunensis, Strain CCMP1510" /NCGR_SAMPLE_ID=MMETSP0890 /ASSEMBLY_ACC=CAM_ASM_000533 /LENGTH=370 /DNA_ID=CAMNT_0042753801 /DNA_START=1603 /DNA_END=2715 /DNA_ORIENTATION=-
MLDEEEDDPNVGDEDVTEDVQRIAATVQTELRNARAGRRAVDAEAVLLPSSRVEFFEEERKEGDDDQNNKGPSMEVFLESIRQTFLISGTNEGRAVQAFKSADVLNAEHKKSNRLPAYRASRERHQPMVIEQRPPFEMSFNMYREEDNEKVQVFTEAHRSYLLDCGFKVETDRKCFKPDYNLPYYPIDRRQQRPSTVEIVQTTATDDATATASGSAEGPNFQLRVCRTIPTFKTSKELCDIYEQPFIEKNNPNRICSPLSSLPTNARDRKRQWEDLSPALTAGDVNRNDNNYLQRAKQYWLINVCEDYDPADSTTILNLNDLAKRASDERKLRPEYREGNWSELAKNICTNKRSRTTNAQPETIDMQIEN